MKKLFLLFALSCAALHAAAVSLFVDGTKSDANAGTSQGAAVATLDRARVLARGYPSSDDVTIWIADGTYRLSSTLTFAAADSGSAGHPRVYKPLNGSAGHVRIIGSVAVTPYWMTSGTDAAAWARLQPAARGKVLVLDLAGAGISMPALARRGFGIATSPAQPTPHWNDEALEFAVWPKQDKLTGLLIGRNQSILGAFSHTGVVSGWAALPTTAGTGGTVSLPSAVQARMATWAARGDIGTRSVVTSSWMYTINYLLPGWGSSMTWNYGEFETYAAPQGGNHIYFFNVLEELSLPGEYVYDAPAGKIYLYKPYGYTSGAIEVSNLDQLVYAGAANYITFETGITWGLNRGNTFNLINCSNWTLNRQDINAPGQFGWYSYGLTNSVLRDLTIRDARDSGIYVDSSGTPATLTPGNIRIINPTVRGFGRLSGSAPAIKVSGCKGSIEGGFVEDGEYQAVNLLACAQWTVTGMRVTNVVRNTSDMSAFYAGSMNPAHWGNRFTNNFVWDACNTAVACPVFYWDNTGQGNVADGNLIIGCSTIEDGYRDGVFKFNGGGYNTVQNNVMIECGSPGTFQTAALDSRVSASSSTSVTYTQTGGVATGSWTSNPLSVGTWFCTTGANQADYNGTFQVLSRTTNSFTFAVPATAAASATGTITTTYYGGLAGTQWHATLDALDNNSPLVIAYPELHPKKFFSSSNFLASRPNTPNTSRFENNRVLRSLLQPGLDNWSGNNQPNDWYFYDDAGGAVKTTGNSGL